MVIKTNIREYIKEHNDLFSSLEEQDAFVKLVEEAKEIVSSSIYEGCDWSSDYDRCFDFMDYWREYIHKIFEENKELKEKNAV